MESTPNDSLRRATAGPRFPAAAGVVFGLGLGGFFDGIVLHQILQWHHRVSNAGYPPDSVHNLSTRCGMACSMHR